jgi:gluconolactonase
MSKDLRILAEGLDHPEAVAWGINGRMWAGGEAGQLYAISLEGAVEEVARTGGFVLGLAVDAEGRV